MRLCLRSRSYLSALPILEKDICRFSTTTNLKSIKRPETATCDETLGNSAVHGLLRRSSYRDYLEYFLYGSMIYMGLKNFERAIHLLQVVISAPTRNSVSMIMVEAYKKWVLANILETGKVLLC